MSSTRRLWGLLPQTDALPSAMSRTRRLWGLLPQANAESLLAAVAEKLRLRRAVPLQGRAVVCRRPEKQCRNSRELTPHGKAVYNQRMHIAETPFAIIKSILGVRRFLLRGLEKVR